MASIRRRPRKGGGMSYAVLYSLDGRQTSLTFNDELGDAEAEAKRFKGLVEAVGARRALEISGYQDARPTSPVTVREWLDSYIEGKTGVERKTLAEYRRFARRDISPVLGDIPVSDLTHADVAKWVNSLPGLGKTVSNKHGFFSAAIAAAVRAGYLSANPCEGMKLPRTEKREMVFLSPEQFNRLYSCFSEHYKSLVLFLVMSGARFSEVSALRPSDVDRVAGTVRISRAWKVDPDGPVKWHLGPTKTAKSTRTIDVDPSVLDGLDYSREWLFVTTRGGPVRIYGWRENVWRPAVRRAGLGVSPRVHDLRHTCASWMIARGVPLPVIQRHLGHESIETTVGIYGHLDRDISRKAARELAAVVGCLSPGRESSEL